MKRILSLHLLFFFVLIFLILPAYAQDEDINLINLPSQLAEHWGITPFASGLFLSSMLGFAFLIPTMILIKRNSIGIVIIGFSVMSFCIAVGWLPYWILLLLCLLIASMYASKISKSL